RKPISAWRSIRHNRTSGSDIVRRSLRARLTVRLLVCRAIAPPPPLRVVPLPMTASRPRGGLARNPYCRRTASTHRRTSLNPPWRRSGGGGAPRPRRGRGAGARCHLTTQRHDASAVTLIRTVRIVFTPTALQPLHHPAGGPPPHDRFAATGRISTESLLSANRFAAQANQPRSSLSAEPMGRGTAAPQGTWWRGQVPPHDTAPQSPPPPQTHPPAHRALELASLGNLAPAANHSGPRPVPDDPRGHALLHRSR